MINEKAIAAYIQSLAEDEVPDAFDPEIWSDEVEDGRPPSTQTGRFFRCLRHHVDRSRIRGGVPIAAIWPVATVYAWSCPCGRPRPARHYLTSEEAEAAASRHKKTCLTAQWFGIPVVPETVPKGMRDKLDASKQKRQR